MLILLSSKLATAKIILCALWPEVKKYTISEKKYKISLQSLFPWASMEIRVPKVLEKLHADEDTVLILQSSTNDITNLREGTDREAMAEKSARQMINVAQRAITDFTLQKVIFLTKGSRKNETTYSTFDTQYRGNIVVLYCENIMKFL